MNKMLKHIFFLVAVSIVILLPACNSNEVKPIAKKAPVDPNELLTITSAEVTSTFDAAARQTIQFRTVAEENNVGNFYFYASHNVNSVNSGIRNVIFSVHGLSALDGAVQSEYNSMNSAVNSSSAGSSTMVIAPHFFHEGTGAEIDWDNAVWRAGGKASSPSGAPLSSSQIIDYFLTELLLENSNFPDLTNVIIAGHSAGGQFVQRYASISETEGQFPDYTFTYLAANASHYAYPNSLRWNGSDTYLPIDCDTYDDYPYGLSALTEDSRYAFISLIGLENIRVQFINRKVYYVLGELDVNGATSGCESENQQGGSGDSRYQRGQYMLQYMNNQYPTNEHEILSVPGVGHSADGIYNSPEHVQLLNQLLQ
ncbi:hypothetical protein [Fulvivirga lutea]|uniref:Alpha/beta hydrolase n=1 Tax=Fulvivirga lutea TaxID=2810512 RepID=A0A974WHQ9_9BACT|nr:hypothetical protein [Fulvivirga lutea]QSE98758.1 hypothetical protein JR347_06670 [Fulvivirga lutea]